ncbi:MAG: membrane protein insertion efficiency factor YidD [Desulfobacteraceae bacterium]|nr:MAG: membrane protein insertion efficiency factor YidD [Desulfobacteraceae bacterium]
MLQINAVNMHKHFFRRVFWAGLGFFLFGCGAHHLADPADQRTQDPVSQIVHCYQGPLDHLSAVRYGGCPMAPNCSAYSLTAIERHGPFEGVMMTFDRLIRCGGDELDLSPEVMTSGGRRTYDPVEANELNAIEPSKEISEWEISVE